MSGFIQNSMGEFKQMGTLTRLLIINAAVFLILNLTQHLVGIQNDEMYFYVGLPSDPSWWLPRFFTFVTYMFTHISFGHLFWNMLTLFMMGQIFNFVLSPQRMWFVYLGGGLSGALFYLLIQNSLSFNGALVGASASISAIMVAIAFYAPNFVVNLFLLGEVRLKWVVMCFFLMSTIMNLSENFGGKVSHIGGALFGMFYALQLKKGNDWFAFFSKRFSFKRSKMKVVHRQKVSDEEYNINKKEEEQLLNEILDKMKKSSYESLSKKDKEILHRLSKKL